MRFINMYCLYDKVLQDSSTIFLANNHAHALRQMEHALEQDRHPEDKELWYLGDFSPEDHDITELEHGPEKIEPSVKHVAEKQNASI